MEEIFNIIQTSFSSLWNLRMRGETMELITPFATSNNLFISLFISRREDYFVVSDGGWMSDGVYQTRLPDDPMFDRLFSFFQEECDINSVHSNGKIFYYKTTDDIRLIPNLVFDMAEFARSVISGSFIQFQAERELKAQNRYSRKATEFLREIIPHDNIYFNKSINDNLGFIRFNAIINKRGRTSLINYVTGSTDNYFINSLGKSTMKFDIVEEHPISETVERKITLIDTTTRIFRSEKIQPYYSILGGRNNREAIFWDDREQLRSLA